MACFNKINTDLCYFTEESSVWYKKLEAKSCKTISKYISDVRLAMEDCKKDSRCIAVSDDDCNLKGTFGLCTEIAKYSHPKNCVYEKRKGDV